MVVGVFPRTREFWAVVVFHSGNVIPNTVKFVNVDDQIIDLTRQGRVDKAATAQSPVATRQRFQRSGHAKYRRDEHAERL